jgi:hypothetical protein
MKEDFPSTDGKRYLSPDSKGPTTKGRKPKHLKPKGARISLEHQIALDEALVGGMLKAVATHFGTTALRATPAGREIFGAAKAIAGPYRHHLKNKSTTPTSASK